MMVKHYTDLERQAGWTNILNTLLKCEDINVLEGVDPDTEFAKLMYDYFDKYKFRGQLLVDFVCEFIDLRNKFLERTEQYNAELAEYNRLKSIYG